MEEIKVKKKKPLFSRFEWICIIIFAVFGIVGLILHFLGFDDIKGNAAEVQTLASQTDYLLVSKNDPYIMIGTPDPDGELPVDVLKVDAYGFYNFFKVPSNISLTPFPITLEAWNTLFNQLFGQPASNKNDGTVLMRYRMSAGNLDEFTGYMPVTTISHQDYYVVKAILYAAKGAVAWLSTNNYIKASPVPRLSGADLYNVYYFYVYENGSPHFYAVSSGGVLNLHRASSDDATARITYREGMVLYSYESNGWQGPINGSQSYFDSLGVPYVFNFENTAGMLKYDEECMCAVRMMSFADQQVSPTPTVSPTPNPDIHEYNILLNLNGNKPSYVSLQSYLISFNASGVTSWLEHPLDDTLQQVLSDTGTSSNVLKYNALVKRTAKYSGSWIGGYYGQCFLYYVKCTSYSDLVYHYSSSSFGTSDFDSIKSLYPSSELTLSPNTTSTYYPYYYVQTLDDGYLLCFVLRVGEYGSCSYYDYSSDIWFQERALNNTQSINMSVPFENLSIQYWNALDLMLDASNSAVPDPNEPTPTPTDAPTPTPAYTVYIDWPTPTPTPTPVIVFNPNFPSGIPLGNDSMDSVLDDGGSLLSGNAVAVLSRAISFFPAILMKLWWFWIFLLIIVATIRAFVHFTG